MGLRAGVQVSRRKLYRYIHLDYVRVKSLSYINNNNNKKKKTVTPTLAPFPNLA